MDQNQQYYNPFQTMSMNTNPEQYMQMQMQYQMQLQQMQQMQHAGAVQQGTADMMVVQNNINSSNPYGGMIQNPYFNFGMQMPTSSTMQMIPGMQMMQMPGLQMVPRTMSNPSLQQMDGSSVATSCGIQARVEVTNSGMSAMAPSNTQQMQSFDPVASTATANPYPYYPYIPPVNPYMYMGMGGMGEAPYDPYKVLGKYAPVSGLPYGVMTPFNNPSPAGMNPKPQPPGSSSSHTIAQNNIDKLTPPEVDAANSSVLVISWITILEEFDKRYDVVFESCSAKIHLDTSKTIIDGAKGRWRHVTLLDTLIAYGLGRERSKEDCERRRFNQYLALQEAVCFACAEALIWHSTELFSKGDKSTSSTVNPYMCTVTDIPQAWSTTENLKMDLLHQSSKVIIHHNLIFLLLLIIVSSLGRSERTRLRSFASSGWC